MVLIIILALAYGFSNGYRDSSSIAATAVSTRAISSRKAFLLCAVAEAIGAMFIGTAVIRNIGGRFFAESAVVTLADVRLALVVAFVSALLWGVVGWLRAWPISNTQALFAGFLGASLSAWDMDAINKNLVFGLFAVLLSSPLIGFVLAMFFTAVIRWIGTWMTPVVIGSVQKLQVFFSLMVSAAHGSNDGQVILALIALAGGVVDGGSAPPWIRFLVAGALSLGVMLGGKRLMKKMGMKFYRIKPSQGLGAQMASAATIFGGGAFGFPASAMQVLTGGIVGAGVAKNFKSIRWEIAGDILLSWFITIPAAGFTGFLIHSAVRAMN